MGSCFFVSSFRRALAHFFVLWQFLVLASGESHESIVQNGNFEDLTGYYPAGVVLRSVERNQNAAVKQWTVQEGAIEIISSRLWPGSTAESMYAVHLNSPKGPGAIKTKIHSTLTPGQTYLLDFDVASTSGGPAVKTLEVSVSDCESTYSSTVMTKSFPFIFSEGNGNSKHLTWRPIRALFKFSGSGHGAVLSFRSLTPGSRGLILDNIKLSLVSCARGECGQADVVLDLGGSEDGHGSSGRSSLGLLKERVIMTTETWFRQRFLRRHDW